jgi:hypothetical protein
MFVRGKAGKLQLDAATAQQHRVVTAKVLFGKGPFGIGTMTVDNELRLIVTQFSMRAIDSIISNMSAKNRFLVVAARLPTPVESSAFLLTLLQMSFVFGWWP